MAGIVSGVNVITEFETPESASYSGYIDYMNKEQGKQISIHTSAREVTAIFHKNICLFL